MTKLDLDIENLRYESARENYRTTRTVARTWLSIVIIISVTAVAVTVFSTNPHLIFGVP